MVTQQLLRQRPWAMPLKKVDFGDGLSSLRL
jgi:hypothetical protein